MALADLLRNFGQALVSAVAPASPAVAAAPAAAPAPSTAAGSTTTLTTAHYDGLTKLIAGLPVGELLDLIEGKGTVDADLDLAEQAAAIVAQAFPPAAITAGEVGLGLEALKFLLDMAGYGSSPFKIEPGQRPIVGGWAGSRGHVY